MKKGFTLMEVMIVVVIAVSVAAFAVPAYKKSREQNLYLAAEGRLIELSSGLRNVIQMYKGQTCKGTATDEKYKNNDGTLNKLGCEKYPHECFLKNGYSKATSLGSFNGYTYKIEEDCEMCMSRSQNTKSSIPYKVCVDVLGQETLFYPGVGETTRNN